MAIDVIIPGTTQWVFVNAGLGPGEKVETALDLNGRYGAVAYMASCGYVASAQIDKATDDVEADIARLNLLQGLQAGRIEGLDFSTTEAAKASTDLLKQLGADLNNPQHPQVATMYSNKVTGWGTTPGGVPIPVVSAFTPIKLGLPPVLSSTQFATALQVEQVPLPDIVQPVYMDAITRNLFYVVQSAQGQRFVIDLGPAIIETDHLTGALSEAQKSAIAQSIDPAKLDAEIEKTIQISQGKQTYLQTLTTDYSTYYTTAGNLMQDYLKHLANLIAHIG
jgi:hypothetical protein